MDSLMFLHDSIRGNITVVTRRPNGETFEIPGINISIVRNHSRILADQMDNDDRSLYIPDSSSDTVAAMLRYMYLGDYTICQELCDGPVSLLLHLQLYLLADRFEIKNLQSQVESRLWGDVENASDLRTKPPLETALDDYDKFQLLSVSEASGPIPDLCEGLRLLYSHPTLRKLSQFRTLIAKYCVATFDAYGYADSVEFIQTVFQSPLLHADLIKANFEVEKMVQGIIVLLTCTDPLHQKSSEPWSDSLDFTCWDDVPHRTPITRFASETMSHLTLPIRTAPKLASEKFPPLQPSSSNPFVKESPTELRKAEACVGRADFRKSIPSNSAPPAAPQDIHPAFRIPNRPLPRYQEPEKNPPDYVEVYSTPDHVMVAPQPPVSASFGSAESANTSRHGVSSRNGRIRPRYSDADWYSGKSPRANIARTNKRESANTSSSETLTPVVYPLSRNQGHADASITPSRNGKLAPPATSAHLGQKITTSLPMMPKVPVSDEEWIDLQSPVKGETDADAEPGIRRATSGNSTVFIGQNVRFGDAVIIGRQDAHVESEDDKIAEKKVKTEPDIEDDWEVLEMP